MALRPLLIEDIDGAFELSSLAGWNQTRDDWRLLLETAEVCLAVEAERRLASTATLICYGTKLAWVGMVLTHPDFRRRGFARLLMNEIMARACELKIGTVKLDATDFGRDLYESFGFRAEQTVERWERPGGPDESGLPRDRIVLGRSYVGDRPGRLKRYLGPCVAPDAVAARELISSMLARAPGIGWCWDLLPENRAAVQLARDLGFERVRTLTRMVWGRDLREHEEQVFAISGFELG
ncbi:MAG TPA: GNAT family N-acetyltransferase [Bryobacteraceae bacterium]|nr:GNAT family N-acetyltransferase [Bryobacteraceae bacterium]